MKRKVIIVGAGFGGLTAARSLKNSDCEILLIDKTNHHLFQPLLYQVATAALSPADIATPIRSVVNKQKNVKVILSEVKKVDLDNRKVFVSIEDEQEMLKEYSYDYLILAVGSKHSYFGKDEWAKYAPGLKTISDALYIREKMLLSFEKAELLNDAKEIEKYLTFVIVGGGSTGVELAGAIAEIAKRTMLKDFRNIDPSKTKILLVEASDRILPAFDSSLSDKAKKSLTKLGVNIFLNSKVTEINKDGVKINGKFIETYNVIWAAGNSIPSLIQSLNVEVDKIGRAIVQKDCSLKNHPEVFVIGDAALFMEDNKPLPAIAPVAIQQGKYVANIIKKNIPPENRKPFKYFDKGIMATIGKAKAVAQIWKLKFSGLLAWIIWCFVHILYLISFRNRYRVMAEWIWLYITNRNGIRLITHKLEEKK